MSNDRTNTKLKIAIFLGTGVLTAIVMLIIDNQLNEQWATLVKTVIQLIAIIANVSVVVWVIKRNRAA